MNHSIEFESSTYDIEDGEDVVGLTKSLVNGQFPGLLATVDQEGRPQVRWMSTLAFDGFPVFQTLTSPQSRKVAEIKARSDVNWMFFNQDLSLVVNLRGKARIVDDPRSLKEIWQRIVDMSHAYFLNEYTTRPGFVAIETAVETIECSSPKNSFRFTVAPSTLAHANGTSIRASSD